MEKGRGRVMDEEYDQCIFISRCISLIRNGKDYVEVKRVVVMCGVSSLIEMICVS